MSDYSAIPKEKKQSNARTYASGTAGFVGGLAGYGLGEDLINGHLKRKGQFSKTYKALNKGHRWVKPKVVGAAIIGAAGASAASRIANSAYDKAYNSRALKKWKREHA
jgi:hypothetical protein